MTRHLTLAYIMFGTAAILACILAPALGFATEPSVNEQLVQAAKKGDLEQVKTLVARGGDVNAEDGGRTALMYAVDPRNLMGVEPMLTETAKKAYLRSGNLDLVKFLVGQGADTNVKDACGCTALMYSVKTEDLAIVKFLVDQGADVNTRGRFCDYAMASGRNVVCPSYLNRQDYTALALAAESRNVEIMEFLIEKGADMNVKDECGMTVLVRAAHLGHPNVVKYLVKKGADVNAREKFGRTPLSYASAKGKTALMRATDRGNLEVVQYLKAHGAK